MGELQTALSWIRRQNNPRLRSPNVHQNLADFYYLNHFPKIDKLKKLYLIWEHEDGVDLSQPPCPAVRTYIWNYMAEKFEREGQKVEIVEGFSNILF